MTSGPGVKTSHLQSEWKTLLELIKSSLMIFAGLVRSVLVPEILPIFCEKNTDLFNDLGFNPFSCGGRFCTSLLPRGFSIIVPKLFDAGFGTF